MGKHHKKSRKESRHSKRERKNREKDCKNKYCGPISCSKCDPSYKKAVEVLTTLNNAINLTKYDPQASATMFASVFAENGIWATETGNIVGKAAIYEASLEYGNSGFETGQTVTIQGDNIKDQNPQIFWDPCNRTISVERLWYAVVVQVPRVFFIPYSNEPVNLNTGDSYEQDDYIIMKFDCDWNVTYYREYYDPNQIKSSYTLVPQTTRATCCGSVQDNNNCGCKDK